MRFISTPQTMDHAESERTRKLPSSFFPCLILLFLASIHCTTSIFFVNYSYLDLKAYVAGTERMPYQGRVGMIPVLRLAEQSPRFVSIANSFNQEMTKRHKHSKFQEITPESLACMIVGALSVLASVTVAAFYGVRRFRQIWWLPPVLLLAMLYVTQAARYETALWYPYDLPHAALFGAACLCILEGAWIPALLLFAVDLPVRETSIFLVAVSVTVAWARGQIRQGVLVTFLMAAIWICFRVYIHHRYAANATEIGVRYKGTFFALLSPFHWPQMTSAFGFLAIPLCLNRKYLSSVQRAFLIGAAPCIAVTLAFGVWAETRIFGEWLLPAAVLLTAEVNRRFALGEPAQVILLSE